jgi:beta-glucosidase
MPSPATDPAELTTGSGYWTTFALAEPALRELRLADGPHGLRVQDDDNPDHLGLGRSLPATCFPPAVTLASSWDRDLVRTVGAALGREAAALGVDVVLGPGMNIKRTPLCGRNFEYFSEDPLLTGCLAGAMVAGIQSNAVAACLKHFAANNQETDRLRVSAEIGQRALRETYLRAFEVALRETPAWSIMSAYNRINGTYASENHWLLTQVLRDEWGYDGVVVSDWGAVHDPVTAFAAGLDLRMPGHDEPDTRVREAVSAGALPAEAVEQTLHRLQLLAERTTREAAPADERMFDEHHDLTRRAAAESAVLLQNGGMLPLLPRPGTTVAIVGELAKAPRYQGAGSSAVNPTRVVSGWDALAERLEAAGATVVFAPGYRLDDDAPSDRLAEAVDAVAAADCAIVFAGLPPRAETEGRDRTSLDLPDGQLALLAALAEVDTPAAVVLSNGGVVRTAGWRGGVDAVVEFWLTGQAHGDAIADVLLGRVNPSGKLTETIPLRIEDTPAHLNFPGESGRVFYGEGIHVGYRYYDAKQMQVDLPFGHGLSYTTFAYADLRLELAPPSSEDAFVVEVAVTNTGSRAGAEVVQVYASERSEHVEMPVRQLRGFAKVLLQPGETRAVRIGIRREDLGYFSEAAGRWLFEPGVVRVDVGSSSRDIRAHAQIEVPGERLRHPLSEWSTWGEWWADEDAHALLAEAIERGGGLRGRLADLIVDPTGSESVLGLPLQTLVEFPGFPVKLARVHELMRELVSRREDSATVLV